ncbi:alginate lyase family protein [Paenibacillus qinlingensis]|uniref:alginate lyase family protein n=1 Tax=Paenibacillus qinlingensis TaxID=1837343 RepID=UPI001565CF53|nr:alginate lyase family protein [Paenibacillus qinlingensis]NQX57857.1 alginate lyase family protein [Paenibacillus qinlingensis]
MMQFYLTNAELREAAGTFKAYFPIRVEHILEQADHSCAGQFKLPYTMAAGEWIDHGLRPDWLYNPTEDLEYTWILNRHWHLRDLGIAYILTGDERYVEAYKRHITSWIEQNPKPTSLTYEQMVYFQRPGPWRLLEVGLRVQSWVWGYMLMSHSALMDGDFERKWRDSLAEQATFLSRHLGDTSINHATMHMQGLFMVGTFLSNHGEAPYWRQLAQERLTLCLHDQIREDGIQNELTPHYHTASLDMFGTPFLLAKQTGHPFPNRYLEKLKSMVAFSVATIRPDGKAVALSDSDSGAHVRAKVGFIGAICEDEAICQQGEISEGLLWLLGSEKFVYWTERIGGMEKEIRSTVAFPDSGYYVMQDAQQYVFFDAAPLGGAHGHADALHFEWMHGGRLIFGDSGRYTYQEGEWRRYFKGTSAHNTITVDGQDQTPYLSTQQWGEPEATVELHRWLSCEAYDFIDASHHGYARLSEPVAHRRWLLMGKSLPLLLVVDELDGVGTHEIEQMFHLSDQARVMDWSYRIDEGLEALISYGEELGKTSGCRMYWAGSAGAQASLATKEGWRSDDYGTKKVIPVLAYRQSFTQRAVIATLCLPECESNESEAWQVTLLKVNEVEGRTEIQILLTGSVDSQVAIMVNQRGVSIEKN